MATVSKVISGGQSGVDRAALDAAIAADVPYGGCVPKGGLAEDFADGTSLLDQYPDLTVAPTATYNYRTLENVRTADATLIVVPDLASWYSPGTRMAHRAATSTSSPCAFVTSAEEALAFIKALPGESVVLNVAGPRRSEWERGYDIALEIVSAALGRGGTA